MGMSYTFSFSEAETVLIANCLQELPFKTVAPLVLRLEKEFQIQRKQQIERPDTGDGFGPGAQQPDPPEGAVLVDEDGKEIKLPRLVDDQPKEQAA